MSELAIIGGGPAGLMAAEVASAAGVKVLVYDAMPSVGRKFLQAGVGGLNLTHAEPRELFERRYFEQRATIARLLDRLDAEALRAWAHGLGVDTFVGSSGRVFPLEMKAAPLLRAWLRRLRQQGVEFHVRHRWLGFGADQSLRFGTPRGEISRQPTATVLALGGASWARLGSDGAWRPWLLAQGVDVRAFKPSNCGFEIDWSANLRTRFAGAPLKSVRLTAGAHSTVGELIVTDYGIEGSLVYAHSKTIREQLEAQDGALIALDLKPDLSADSVQKRLAHPRAGMSFSNHLRKSLGLSGVHCALIYETSDATLRGNVEQLGALVKALPLRVVRPRPLDEAISTAGGVAFADLNPTLMLNALPGVFCAGEMLDWEAPTGGYLLTACFASGALAGDGALAWLQGRTTMRPGQAEAAE